MVEHILINEIAFFLFYCGISFYLHFYCVVYDFERKMGYMLLVVLAVVFAYKLACEESIDGNDT